MTNEEKIAFLIRKRDCLREVADNLLDRGLLIQKQLESHKISKGHAQYLVSNNRLEYQKVMRCHAKTCRRLDAATYPKKLVTMEKE